MKFVNLVATTAATFFATSLNAATTGGRLVAAGTDGQTDTPSHTAGQPQPVENFHLVYGDGTAVFGGNKARRREKRMIATTHVSVRLQFTVGSSSYDVSMIRQPSLFEAGSTIKFADGTGEHSVEDIEAPNYRAADNAGVLTLNNDETYMKGIVVSQTLGKTLEVSGSPSGGLTAVDLVFNLNFNLDGIRLRETDSPFPATPDHDAGTRRRHSAVQRRNQNGIGFGRYTPFFGLADNDPIAPTCFEGDSTMRSVTVGIFLGSALHSTQATDGGSTAYEPPFQTINDHPPFANSGGNAINSDGNAIAHLTSWFSAANLIYEGNLNIKLLMGDIVKGTGAESWDACTETGFTKGAEGITDRALGRFQNYIESGGHGTAPLPTKYPLFHLFNDCRPPGGASYTAGAAYTQGLCNAGNGDAGNIATNVGLTYTSRDIDATWVTFAHEIGHNFAAAASAGATPETSATQGGGIMDYASNAHGSDVAYNGVIQFNHGVWKDAVCENLADKIHASASCNVPQYVEPWLIVCANGDVKEACSCAAITATPSGTAAGVAGGSCLGGRSSRNAQPECTFICAPGYDLDFAAATLKCGINGTWPAAPTCSENTCVGKSEASDWTDLGCNVDTEIATTVSGLGTIAPADGWKSCAVTCLSEGAAYTVSSVYTTSDGTNVQLLSIMSTISVAAGATLLDITDVSQIISGDELKVGEGTNAEIAIVDQVRIGRRSRRDAVDGAVTLLAPLKHSVPAGTPVTYERKTSASKAVSRSGRLCECNEVWWYNSVHYTACDPRVPDNDVPWCIVRNTATCDLEWMECELESAVSTVAEAKVAPTAVSTAVPTAAPTAVSTAAPTAAPTATAPAPASTTFSVTPLPAASTITPFTTQNRLINVAPVPPPRNVIMSPSPSHGSHLAYLQDGIQDENTEGNENADSRIGRTGEEEASAEEKRDGSTVFAGNEGGDIATQLSAVISVSAGANFIAVNDVTGIVGGNAAFTISDLRNSETRAIIAVHNNRLLFWQALSKSYTPGLVEIWGGSGPVDVTTAYSTPRPASCACNEVWWYNGSRYTACDPRMPGNDRPWCMVRNTANCGLQWMECELESTASTVAEPPRDAEAAGKDSASNVVAEKNAVPDNNRRKRKKGKLNKKLGENKSRTKGRKGKIKKLNKSRAHVGVGHAALALVTAGVVCLIAVVRLNRKQQRWEVEESWEFDSSNFAEDSVSNVTLVGTEGELQYFLPKESKVLMSPSRGPRTPTRIYGTL